MNNSFYSDDELSEMGFCSVGRNVFISRKASVYTPELVTIGDNVRIDDFCILSGKVSIGSYIHISAYTAIYARFGVVLEDFVTVSGRVIIYSQNDDYSGQFMTNPMVPAEYTNITGGGVLLKKHSIIAAGSIILPTITIGEGACLGSMSLAKSDLEPWFIYAGIPARKIRERENRILLLESQMKLEA
jgi:acetyltransferase-like isoleucine patch superfamily enzyme